MATMAVSFTVFDIKLDIGGKMPVFHTHFPFYREPLQIVS